MEIELLIHLNKEKVRIMYMAYNTVVSACKNLLDLHYFFVLFCAQEISYSCQW